MMRDPSAKHSKTLPNTTVRKAARCQRTRVPLPGKLVSHSAAVACFSSTSGLVSAERVKSSGTVFPSATATCAR